MGRGDRMKLIVGFGNPGKEYEHTRHNIGFDVLDRYALKHSFSFNKEKFRGLYFETTIGNEKVIFLKPQKYINLSGEVMYQFAHYFKIDLQDILVIHDDLDLPVGKIRLREFGHSGGHNGLKNVELYFKSISYKRIKVGIANNKQMDTKDYVLGKFCKEDREIIDQKIDLICEIIDAFFTTSFINLMNQYNS